MDDCGVWEGLWGLVWGVDVEVRYLSFRTGVGGANGVFVVELGGAEAKLDFGDEGGPDVFSGRVPGAVKGYGGLTFGVH